MSLDEALDVSGRELGGQRPPGRRGLRRFARNRLAVVSAWVFLLIVAVAAFGPLVLPHSPTSVDLDAIRQGPSPSHLLGTDSAGRDVLARTVHAARVSLLVGVVAALLSIVIGAVLGALAGLFGGVIDTVIMRLADIVLAIPTIVLVIVLAGVLGPSIPILILAIGATHWPQACRVVQGVTLAVKEKEYVQAARAGGAGQWRLIRTHLLPAALPPLIVAATLAVAQAILLEATLSFLGLGVRPPTPSWGNMLNDAQNLTLIQTMPWLWVPPGLAIALTVLAVNFMGDGLRDAFDPRQSKGGVS